MPTPFGPSTSATVPGARRSETPSRTGRSRPGGWKPTASTDKPARRLGVGRQRRRGAVLAKHRLQAAPGLQREGPGFPGAEQVGEGTHGGAGEQVGAHHHADRAAFVEDQPAGEDLDREVQQLARASAPGRAAPAPGLANDRGTAAPPRSARASAALSRAAGRCRATGPDARSWPPSSAAVSSIRSRASAIGRAVARCMAKPSRMASRTPPQTISPSLVSSANSMDRATRAETTLQTGHEARRR